MKFQNFRQAEILRLQQVAEFLASAITPRGLPNSNAEFSLDAGCIEHGERNCHAEFIGKSKHADSVKINDYSVCNENSRGESMADARKPEP